MIKKFFLALLLIYKSIYFQSLANTNIKLNFVDTNPKGGLLNGDLKVSYHSDNISFLEIYWGSNREFLLERFRPLLKIPIKSNGPQNIKIFLKNLKIPPGANHFIIYSVLENNQSYPILSYPIIDLGVPTYKAEGLSFQQTRSEAGRIQGEIRILPAMNERDIEAYAVYWGSAENVVIRSEGSLSVFQKPGFWGSLWRGINQPWTEPGYIFFKINVLK